jgi:hypothetical protein
MRSALIALCSTLLFPLPGTASTSDDETVFPQQMNAGKLMTYCASSALTARGRTQRRYCDGFVSGIEEVMRLYKFTFTAESNVAVCVPAGTSSRTLSQAFVQHATSQGVDLDQPAAAVVLEALQHSFAC